ncbi:hypothetical protein [Nonomuraea maheshkhaliensis]
MTYSRKTTPTTTIASRQPVAPNCGDAAGGGGAGHGTGGGAPGRGGGWKA